MAKPPEHTTPLDQAKFYGIPNIKRHLLLCAGPECCDPARGEIAWNYLKKRFAELKLQGDPTHVFRTRCACLRICTQGPILAVQPDNTWYHSADPEILERIVQEHLLKNEVVQEFAFVNHPLCTNDSPPAISP